MKLVGPGRPVGRNEPDEHLQASAGVTIQAHVNRECRVVRADRLAEIRIEISLGPGNLRAGRSRPVRLQRRRRRHRSCHPTVSHNPHRHERKHTHPATAQTPLPGQLPPPEQQIAADPCRRRHRYRHTRRQALGDNPQLLLDAPPSPPLDVGDHLNPLVTSSHEPRRMTSRTPTQRGAQLSLTPRLRANAYLGV